jgi:hypothetical protein
MQGLFFESDTGVRYVIRFLVVLIGFWTAWRSGKAKGATGRPVPMLSQFLLNRAGLNGDD